MTDKKIAITVCWPLNAKKDTSGKPVACFECILELWLSDTTARAAEGCEIRPYCPECGFKLVSKNAIPIQALTREQEEELERIMKQ